MDFEKGPMPHELEAELVLIELDLKRIELVITTIEYTIEAEANSPGVQKLYLQLLDFKATRAELLGKQAKLKDKLNK